MSERSASAAEEVEQEDSKERGSCFNTLGIGLDQQIDFLFSLRQKGLAVFYKSHTLLKGRERFLKRHAPGLETLHEAFKFLN